MDPQTGLSAAAPSTVVATTTAPAAKSTAAPTASVPAPAVSAQSGNGAAAKNQPSASAPLSTPSTAAGNASLVNASATNVPASASPKAADLFEVPEDYADDQVIHRVHPIYPKGARAKKLQGTVVLQAIIDKQGKVDSLQMVSGDPLLAQAAADAVKQWRYKPYSHNGDPVEFQTRITVDFKLP
jgi:TonB family protein